MYATVLQPLRVARCLLRLAATSKAPPSLGSGLSRSQCSFERHVRGLDGCQLVTEILMPTATGSVELLGCKTGPAAGGITHSAASDSR